MALLEKVNLSIHSVEDTGWDPDRVAGNGERLVAGRRGRRVFDLSAQVLHPVLQVLLVCTHHLDPLEHRPCGRWETAAAVTTCDRYKCDFEHFRAVLPLSSNAFL